MLTRTTLLSLSLALATLLLMASAAQAAGGRILAKPPTATPVSGPPLDGGTIYYQPELADPDPASWTIREIAPNGTGDAVVAGVPSAGGPQPSKQLHNGSRWFLTLRSNDGLPGYFPGGGSDGRLWELDVLQEGGHLPVPLTDNAGACIQIWGGGPGVRFDWAPDANGQIDGTVTWIGTRWLDVDDNGSCDQVIDGGIFRGAIAIDSSGNVSFSQPTQPEVVVALSGTSTRAAELSWAPDGRQVAYKDANGADLWVVDAVGNRSMIFNGRVFGLDWSPDLDPSTAGLQTRIAFTGFVSKPSGADSEAGTYTIAPDGTNRMRIAAGRLSNPPIYHFNVSWSPAGSHLVYEERTGTYALTQRIRRVAANGTNDVVLIDDSTTSSGPFARKWTAD